MKNLTLKEIENLPRDYLTTQEVVAVMGYPARRSIKIMNKCRSPFCVSGEIIAYRKSLF